MNPIKCNKCRTEIAFDDKVRSLNGKKSKHNCPNSEYNKCNGEVKGTIFTRADQLLEQKTIDNARWFIDGLNHRLERFKIEPVIKEIYS